MSTLQTINVKHPSSASNNVVLDNSGNTTISGNATISGSATVGGVAVVTTTGTQTLTNKTLTSPTISGTPVMSASVLTLMTAQNSTSGTFIDFTGIPSWVRRITVIFNNVSTNGASPAIVQIGSGSFTTSGYFSQASNGTVATGVITNGLAALFTSAPSVMPGHLVLTFISSNTWISSGVHSYNGSTAACTIAAGVSPGLSGALDRVRITTVNGTDVFDAGSINVLYE